MTTRTIGGTALALVCAAAVGCGGSNSTTPTPTATPTPAPAPTPTPTPNPGSIGAFTCKLPPSSNPLATGIAPCPVLPPKLGTQVNGAIDKVLAEHPELFDFNDLAGSSPRVLNRDKYLQFVAENLVQGGVCTVIEKEELAVKNTNEFNEQWNVWASNGFVRRRYVTTCAPSWF